MTNADRTRAVLMGYQQVKNASWPGLHPEMAERSRRWPTASEDALQSELLTYLRDASRPTCPVRVFWKFAPGFTFGGCNDHFAQDAGMPAAQLVGRDDFDPKLPWVLQAAKYRADDEAVFRSGMPKLDIIERQRSSSGIITWVRVGKAPIRLPSGAVIGILGMYEVLDAETGHKLFAERGGKDR